MITVIQLSTKLVFGPGSINQLGDEAKALGKKAMIATYPDLRRVGLLDRVIKILNEKGVDTLVFDEVEPNPRRTTIDKGAGIARKSKVDLLIGLGGGSAMDTAKGIALASAGSESIWHYVTAGPGAKTGPVPSLIQVPTIAATGSELNSVIVVTDWETHEKSLVINPNIQAKVAIVDPEVTITLPKKQTAAGGIDIFSHLMEYYLLIETPLPMNDAIREAVTRTVVQYLPKALAKPDDIEARTQLSWGSTIALSPFGRLGGSAGSMTCHGIEHAVSGYYDVTHGEGLAALLPAWMRNILPVRKARLDSMGKNVFGKTDGIRAFEEWLKEVGMSFRLRDFGFEMERAEEIADNAIRTSSLTQAHPTKMDREVIVQIFRESY